MNTRIERQKDESPYSALPCVLLLLAVGIMVKFEIVTQFIHLTH